MQKAPDMDQYLPILESCIIGFAGGLSAVLLSNGVLWLGALRVHLSGLGAPSYLLPVFGLVGGLISGLLVEWVAPEASGSGIPQVRARLDRVIMPLDFRIGLVKLIGGTVALGSGFFLGREGPTVQLGAALAAPLARWLPTTAQHKRQLIAAGAGAGLTSAFNAPLAGVTFVLEELLKEIKPSTVIITIVACTVSSFTLNALTPQNAGGPHVILSFAPRDIPYYLLLGVAAGVVSAIFNAGILGALNFNKLVLRMPVTLRIGLAGLISGAIISAMPAVFHNYAGMRALIISGDAPFNEVLLAFFEFYLLTLIGYGSGAPGGLFAPSLALGSALGILIGYIEKCTLGTASMTTFALVGMGAFFSGVARTPLTAIVITFELSSGFDNTAVLTPLMFTCVLSSAIGELVYKGGLYDHLMIWNNIHLEGRGPTSILKTLKATDVMHRKPVFVDSKLPVKEALRVLGSSAQRGLPVVHKGKLVGIMTQTDLVNLSQTEILETVLVKDIMTPHPVAVTPFDSLEDILFLFSHHKFTWLPVIQNDKLKGIILQSDVLKALFTESQVTNSGNGTPVEGKSEQTQVPTSSENTQRLPQEPAKESRSPSADTPT